jgi:hypothetical protein
LREEAEAIKKAKKDAIDAKKKEGTWLTKKQLEKKRAMEARRAELIA